jgi:hypothetical protein
MQIGAAEEVYMVICDHRYCLVRARHRCLLDDWTLVESPTREQFLACLEIVDGALAPKPR